MLTILVALAVRMLLLLPIINSTVSCLVFCNCITLVLVIFRSRGLLVFAQEVGLSEN